MIDATEKALRIELSETIRRGIDALTLDQHRAWLAERLKFSIEHAVTGDPADRAGLIEDATNFAHAIAMLDRPPLGNTIAAQAGEELQAGNLVQIVDGIARKATSSPAIAAYATEHLAKGDQVEIAAGVARKARP